MYLYERPLVSIITVSFNHAKYIEETILSIRQQDYPNVEHIVIDIGSTDGTLDILRKYQDKLRWFSENDYGREYIFSQGVYRSEGDILTWLSPGIVLVPSAIHTIVEYFATHSNDDFIYGDIEALDETGKPYTELSFRNHIKFGGWLQYAKVLDFIVQPSAFWRAHLFKKHDEYGETRIFYQDSMYWKLVSKHLKPHYIPLVLAKKRLFSTVNFFSWSLKSIDEIATMIQRRMNKLK